VCIAICTGETGVNDDVETSTSKPSTHHTCIIWQSSSALRPAINATSVPVHRDNTVSHRDVTRSQSEATRLQQEAETHGQHWESVLGQSRRHSLGLTEQFKPRVHTDTNVNTSNNSSVSSLCADSSTCAMQLSSWETEIAESEASLSSDTKNQTAHRKCKVTAERPSSVGIFSQQVFPNNSNAAVQNYQKFDASSDAEICEWKSMQGATASRQARIVSDHDRGGKQSHHAGIESDRKLSVDSGRRQHRLQNDTDSVQQCAEKEDFITHHVLWPGGVSMPERSRGWTSGGNRHGKAMLVMFVVIT